MTDEERPEGRRRRRKLDRTKPNRQAAGALGDGGLIGASLENMYRIVEPWRAQGEAVARQWGRAYGALAMPESSREAPARLLRSGGDLMSAWVDMLALYTECVLPDWEGGGGDEEVDITIDRACPVAYRVKSARAVYVYANLAAGAQRFTMRTRGIRKSSGIKVRIRNRSHDREEDRRRGRREEDHGRGRQEPLIEIRVKVADEAAAGTCRAHIVNAIDGNILGTLVVEIA